MFAFVFLEETASLSRKENLSQLKKMLQRCCLYVQDVQRQRSGDFRELSFVGRTFDWSQCRECSDVVESMMMGTEEAVGNENLSRIRWEKLIEMSI